MPYFLIMIFMGGFGSGFFFSNQIDKAEITTLESAIQTQSDEAKIMLASAQTHVTEAQNSALIANANLDKAHESAIQTINSLHASLSTVRLYDPGRSRGQCLVSTGADTGQPEAETDSGQLSAELATFLVDQATSADTLAAYADSCFKFVVDNNCGIAKE